MHVTLPVIQTKLFYCEQKIIRRSSAVQGFDQWRRGRGGGGRGRGCVDVE